MIFVNFKTYKQATSSKAVELIQKIVDAQKASGVPIIPVVQIADARLCVNTSVYSVWVQHVDNADQGQSTGWVTVEAAAETGITGTFLNHSEHKYTDPADLKKIADKCRSFGIETAIFASDLEDVKRVVELEPSFVVFEPPELIASKEASVAQAKSDEIREASEACGKIRLIVGAGIKSKEDVVVSLRMGAMGVAVSSAVVLSEDPYKVLIELAGGFK